MIIDTDYCVEWVRDLPSLLWRRTKRWVLCRRLGHKWVDTLPFLKKCQRCGEFLEDQKHRKELQERAWRRYAQLPRSFTKLEDIHFIWDDLPPHLPQDENGRVVMPSRKEGYDA